MEKVRDRLLRATAALENAGILYAVVGGNAVASWVSGVDEAAVRNTQDVDLLIRRSDLDAVEAALTPAGFVRGHAASMDFFLDGPNSKFRDAVHIVFAGEKVRPEHLLPSPDVSESEQAPQFRVVALEALVRMKLIANRDKDRTHVRDMIDVGLIDSSWQNRFTPELASRLQALLENPDG